jgi:hypothetical protein
MVGAKAPVRSDRKDQLLRGSGWSLVVGSPASTLEFSTRSAGLPELLFVATLGGDAAHARCR